jgi:hypothetical protein
MLRLIDLRDLDAGQRHVAPARTRGWLRRFHYRTAFVRFPERARAGEQQTTSDAGEEEQNDTRNEPGPSGGRVRPPMTLTTAAASSAPTSKHGRASIGEASTIRAGARCWIRVTTSARKASP